MDSTSWRNQAVHQITADSHRSGDTNLLRLWLPRTPDIDIYLKDESNHKTGSLKHRLGRSLYTFALVNGLVHSKTTIVEASSGNTAVAEAYFAQLLGLPFIAVMAESTSPAKIKRIERFFGRCHFVKSSAEDRSTAMQIAENENGHFMDQFTYAERASDWRASNNVAESILRQMEMERFPIPTWIVCSAGTGGTSATIGRHLAYRSLPTLLCVVDPENSVYYDYYQTGDKSLTKTVSSRIEGIGRRTVEASFLRSVISRMISVPDAASIGAIHFLEKLTGLRGGGSTGTNLYGSLQLAAQMSEQSEPGSIVTLICDSGEIYNDTYFNECWLAEQNINPQPYLEQIQHFYDTGQWVAASDS